MSKEQFNVKTFIDEIDDKEFRSLPTTERAEYIWSESRRLGMWHVTQSFRERKLREDLLDVMDDPKVLKAVKLVSKDQDSDYGFPAVFAVVLRDLVDTQRRKHGNDEILDEYEKIIHIILKQEIKSLSKVSGISKELAYELLTVLPIPEIVNRKQIVGIYVGRINRKLYIAEDKKFDTIDRIKTIRQIYKYLFGNLDMIDEIALSILLERRPTNDNAKTNIYSLLTTFALDTLEKMEKKEIRDVVKRYAERRKREREGSRRVVLSEIDKEDYPKIAKAVKKVIKNEKELAEFI